MKSAIRASILAALLTLAPHAVEAQVPFLDELDLDLQSLSEWQDRCYTLYARRITRRQSNGVRYLELTTEAIGCVRLETDLVDEDGQDVAVTWDRWGRDSCGEHSSDLRIRHALDNHLSPVKVRYVTEDHDLGCELGYEQLTDHDGVNTQTELFPSDTLTETGSG